MSKIVHVIQPALQKYCEQYIEMKREIIAKRLQKEKKSPITESQNVSKNSKNNKMTAT